MPKTANKPKKTNVNVPCTLQSFGQFVGFSPLLGSHTPLLLQAGIVVVVVVEVVVVGLVVVVVVEVVVVVVVVGAEYPI